MDPLGLRMPSTNYNGSASTYTGTYPILMNIPIPFGGLVHHLTTIGGLKESFDLSFLSGNASVMFRFILIRITSTLNLVGLLMISRLKPMMLMTLLL